MAHIFLGYLHIGITAALKRNPTKEEWYAAIDAVEKYAGPDVFKITMREEIENKLNVECG